VRIRGLGGWREDGLWSYVYPWLVEHPEVGRPAWRLGTGSDMRLIDEAAAEIGELRPGARVLDVPSGSGVALRGLRPGQGVRVCSSDISTTMLGRTLTTARALGVADQVSPAVADVGALPFADATFDLVVTFTGVHVFPDPRAAIDEMVRVLAPGGALTGSSIFTDTGVRYEPLRRVGARAGVLGPMCTTHDAIRWLRAAGCDTVDLSIHGALGYFRATRRDTR